MNSEAAVKMDANLESSHLLSALRDGLDLGVIAVDGAGRVNAFNAAAERLLNRPAASTLGESSSVLPAALRQLIDDASGSFSPPAPRELVLDAPGHPPVEARVHAVVQRAASGAAGGVIVVLQEVMNATSLDRNTRWLDRLASIGTLSAGMAHEIKNAMVAVKTFADLLLRKNHDAEMADMMLREIRRIDSIVSQMLRFAGPAKPTFSTLALHDVVNHALALVEAQARARQIIFTRRFGASSDRIKGDTYQLEQAFLNLFFNALEAMGQHGELIVTTEVLPGAGPLRPAQIRVTVRDTGPGIDPAHVPRLFEPFFTTKPKGTGLGLPITRRIVQEHRGTITVDSAGTPGTTFVVLLPLMP